MFLRGSVSSAQAQGPREYQEDRIVHVPFASKESGRGHLLGILDGHGGAEVAKYCSNAIPRLFNPWAADAGEELRRVVERLDVRTQLFEAGSTLSLAWVHESRRTVTTAVLGDSPVIVVDRTGRAHVSEEHNVRTNPAERQAAVQRGGVYFDGYIHEASLQEGLQLSRALGDRALLGILDRKPAIAEHRLGTSSIVMVASDGLFDPSHGGAENSFLCELLKIGRCHDAGNVLRWRVARQLEDNASVIIWRANPWWKWF